MTRTKKSVISQLKRARKLIEKGWTKGQYESHPVGDEPTCYCTLGALRKVSGRKYYELMVELSHSLPKRRLLKSNTGLSHTWLSIARYNDSPTTTKEKVLKLFDKTISRLQSAN